MSRAGACSDLDETVLRARLANSLDRSGPAGDLREPGRIGLRQAAVLAGLVCDGGRWGLMLTRRSDTVPDHKGQVAFPGGARELEDGSPEETALREAREEIGLPPEKVRLLGRLPDFITITGFEVTPVVGLVDWPFEARLEADEVARLFVIPLEWLADPDHFEERPVRLPDGREVAAIFFATYQGELLWGATARMTVQLLKALDLI